MNELILLTLGQEAGGSAAGGPAGCMQLTPLLLMFVIFYFLLIRPQQKRQKEHREMLSRLKKGDKVVTGGGLIGVIDALTDDELVLEVADRVKVRVLRGQVNMYSTAGDAAASEKK